ncbi:hypothetical protein [Polymorphobacter megasporae]|uniref:hypothetical protein n=1 Tax=Glacieibacterium megasporae TaxID=2835787 RepID=UPI001CAA7E1C|nr:hypothetical protein [Polymorphobacter megasporae]UAJ12403.1 hypothetical protein KTC28_21575 [Polymorphobacter megasporae]
MPAARVKLTYVKYRRQAPGFIEREIAPLQLPGFDPDPAADAPVTSVRDFVTVRPSVAPNVLASSTDAVTPASEDDANGGTSGTPVDTTGEGYQTAVGSEPPERAPIDVAKLITLPTRVSTDVSPAMVTTLKRLSADPLVGATSGKAASQREPSEPDRGDDVGRASEAVRRDQTLHLGLRELTLNFGPRDRSHAHRSDIAGGVVSAPANRRAAEQSTEADVADSNVGRDHDDEHSR